MNTEAQKIFFKVSVGGETSWERTATALVVASALAPWEKILMIDSTGQGSRLIGHPKLGPFALESLCSGAEQPSPEVWVQALIRAADQGYQVVVMDCASEEWDWCLAEKDRQGGKFQSWAKVTPLHNRFVRVILRSPVHVISVLRRKEKFQVGTSGAKADVVSLGLRSEMRKGFERAMDLVVGVDQNFATIIEQDKTELLPKGQSVNPREIGLKLKAWADGADNGKRQ